MDFLLGNGIFVGHTLVVGLHTYRKVSMICPVNFFEIHYVVVFCIPYKVMRFPPVKNGKQYTLSVESILLFDYTCLQKKQLDISLNRP